MILQIIRLKSNLSMDELMSRAKERAPRFKAIPGLLQKHYVKMSGPNEYGGVYIWDSKASLQAYQNSDLASSIPQAYEIIEAPDVEILDILFSLRES